MIEDDTEKSLTDKLIDAGKNPKKQKKKKMSEAQKANPFLEYGIAIENFFNLECRLILIYLIVTLIALPQMIIFATFDNQSASNTSSLFSGINFGSLGQANSLCSRASNIPGAKGVKFLFTCDKDYFIGEIISVGMHALDVDSYIHGDQTSFEDFENVCYNTGEYSDITAEYS